MTYSQRVAWGGLKFLFWICCGAGVIAFIAWLPQILMWMLDK